MSAGGYPIGEVEGAGERLGRGESDELEAELVTSEGRDLGGKIGRHPAILVAETPAARAARPSPRYTRRVPAPLVLAAVAAVLAPEKVVFVDTAKGAIVETARITANGLAIFAAPDARAIVPLAEEDATEVVSPVGKSERWPGRVFPLFSREYDRMQVILPGALVTLSYPERLPLLRIPLAEVPGAIRAASSEDGRLVAVIPEGAGGRTLLIVAAMEEGSQRVVALGRPATSVVMTEEGRAAVTGNGTALEAEVLGEGRARPDLDVGGEVRSLCALATGRDVLAGLGMDQGGAVVGIRVDPKAKQPLKERFRTPMPAPVVALAAAGDDIVAVSGDDVVVLSHKGKRVARSLNVPGARDVALLPLLAKSTVPDWSDARTP